MRDRLARLFALHFQVGSAPGGDAAPGGQPAGGAGATSGQPPATGAGGAASPPAAPAPGTPAPPADGSAPAAGESLDPTILVREREEAKREAQRLRNELKRLTDAEEARQRAAMSEEERKARELADREAGLTARESAARERILSAAIREEAASAGVPPIKLQLVVRLIDPKDVEWNDETHEPKNVKDLVASFVKMYPDFTAQPGGGPAGGAGSADGGIHAGGAKLTKDDIRKMSPAEINARWAEVAEVLRAG